jgi:hypothetical protein
MVSKSDDVSREERIGRRLEELVGPGTAAWFRDARLLMNAGADEAPFALATRSHLIAHQLREIESALGAVLRSVSVAAGLSGPSARERFEEEVRTVLTPLTPTEDLQAVVDGLITCAEPFLRSDSASGHRDRIRAALHALRISESDPAGAAWLRFADPSMVGLAARTHRNGLDEPRPVDAELESLWNEAMQLFDHVLERMAATFVPILERARVLARKPQPGKKDLKVLRQELPPDLVVRREFFAHASPGWAQLLHRHGHFATVPQVEVLDDGSTLAAEWPEAEYLVRVAPDVPDVVSEILSTIRTDAPGIHMALLRAALALPASSAARMSGAATAWASGPYHWFEGPFYGQLIAHLASHGHLREALDLTRAVIGVEVPADPRDAAEARSVAAWLRGPEPRFEWTDYREILDTHLRELADRAPEGLLAVVLDVLDDVIRIRRELRPFEDVPGLEGFAESGSDGRWREDGSWAAYAHVANADTDAYGIEEVLLAHARDLGVQVALADDDPRSVLQLLGSRPWLVFERLALFVLSRAPARWSDTARARLLDRDRFRTEDLRPEYDSLLAATFSRLPQSDRETYLGWVEEGPPTTDPPPGEQPGEDDASESDGDAWRVSRLVAIEPQLDAAWTHRLRSWRERAPEPRWRSAPPAALPEPQPVEDPSALTPDQLIQAIEAGREFDTHALADAVEADPRSHAAVAERFRGLPWTYAAALFEGLIVPARRGPSFPWGPPLALARLVLDDAIDDQADRDAGQVLTYLGELLLRGMAGDATNPIPPDHRPLVEDVVERVSRVSLGALRADSTPSETGAGRRWGWPGERFVHLLVRTAFWLRTTLPPPDRAHAATLDPWIARVLDRLLDLPFEAHPWVPSGFGGEYARLVALDRDWSTAVRDRIFPTGEDGADADGRRVAWDAYLRAGAWSGVAPLLEDRYRWAIRDLPPPEEDGVRGAEPLAHHLAQMVLRGTWSLGTGSVADAFFTKAAVPYRRLALGVLGRAAMPRNDLTAAQRLRLASVWEARLRAAAAEAEVSAELPSFGWWFASGRFPDRWSLRRLEETLGRTGGSIELPRHVVIRLAALSEGRPEAAFRCLVRLALAPGGAAGIASWWTEAIPILSRALACGGETQDTVAELVSRMSAPPYRFAEAARWLREQAPP